MIARWLFSVTASLLLIVGGCSGGSGQSSGQNMPASTPALTWDNGNWDETNWE